MRFKEMRQDALSASDQDTVRDLLSRVREGDPDALNELVPLVYGELEELARAQRRRWHGPISVQTTSLLNEAYLRLAGQASPEWQDRTHFLAVAATAMRQILIDYARAQNARKRGGDQKRVNFDELERFLISDSHQLQARDEVLVVLDDCLTKLAAVSELQVRIVECRFFAGMTIAETAEALRTSPASVKRKWKLARAWLYRALRDAVD